MTLTLAHWCSRNTNNI